MADTYAPHERVLIDLWQAHMDLEFVARDAAATVQTMADDARCVHVPVLTGGSGKPEMLAFYRDHFISKMPADIEIVPVSRTVGQNRVVDELILRFTHDVQMDWMLPGVPPTGKRVEVANVVVVEFDADGKLVSEHIYWDQAAVLVQLGLLDRARLPVTGVESARKVLDQRYCPSNELIRRT